ncbi:uncharacterized protein LAESUDRAFT_321656 [Laetiporus sulphureus 93-53]|uniref:Uncharacterized protein n=1 Tax=Laetiporus sulphureus 93-53 TaxID=1314785 RepID=A0A165D1S5_9APHY|nr:uncharacterized protein LAESUDRAFT_321656 [Laetiporus sulphureus 93-53]KZT03979.1 hypothetical protein LAESUDRAFT_321656 [Laetiporus sulphureus 93-53]
MFPRHIFTCQCTLPDKERVLFFDEALDHPSVISITLSTKLPLSPSINNTCSVDDTNICKTRCALACSLCGAVSLINSRSFRRTTNEHPHTLCIGHPTSSFRSHAVCFRRRTEQAMALSVHATELKNVSVLDIFSMQSDFLTRAALYLVSLLPRIRS